VPPGLQPRRLRRAGQESRIRSFQSPLCRPGATAVIETSRAGTPARLSHHAVFGEVRSHRLDDEIYESFRRIHEELHV
jgi:hypothetical protein